MSPTITFLSYSSRTDPDCMKCVENYIKISHRRHAWNCWHMHNTAYWIFRKVYD